MLSANAADITVTPGKLKDALSEVANTESHLTLSGSMDVRDFHTLVAERPDLTSLDLSKVSIAAFESSTPVSYGPARHNADELPSGALLGLKLTELTLPSGLTTIGEGALAGMQFTELTIPTTVTTIADNALYGCDKLTSITLPSSVKELGAYALAGCTSLTRVDLSATHLTKLNDRLFVSDTSLRTVSLPSTLTSIGEGCFAGTDMLSNISLPGALIEIGKNAFYRSGIESVVIPAAVTEIGDFAFAQCPRLVSAVLEGTDTELGRGLFFADPEFVVFKAPGIATFPDYLFAGDSKFDVAPIMTNLAEIGAYALKDTGAQSLVFGSSLIYLGDGAMENMTSLVDIDATALKNIVPELGEDVFSGINQPETELLVADDLSDAWRGAPQWREFKVITETEKGEMSVSDVQTAAVKCRFETSTLLVESPEDISIVEVYSPSGAKVVSESPRSTHASIEAGHLSERVYIVRVYLSNGDIATFKLMR